MTTYTLPAGTSYLSDAGIGAFLDKTDPRGWVIRAGDILEFPAASNATLICDNHKNLIVKGTLRMRPSSGAVVHHIDWRNIDETKFVSTQKKACTSAFVEPPPPDSGFGPVAGAQSVRNNAGPRTVTNPGGGVSFTSGSNIQTLINANPANTIFVASATGTYTNFRGISATGKHPRFYFPGAASSYSITGTGAGTQIGIDMGTSGMEVYGGTWSQYGNSQAAASYSAPFILRGSSIVSDAVFTQSMKGPGIDNNASQGASETYLFSHCKFLSNLRYGPTGTGTKLYAATVEYCVVEDCNTGGRAQGAAFNPGGDASAQKFGYVDGGIWRNNWFHDNYGFGIWFDGYNRNCLVHDNVTENNTSAGYFYEISYGGTVFEHNLSLGDGKGDPSSPGSYGGLNSPFNNAGILVSCSPCDGTGTVLGGGPNVTTECRYNLIDVSGGAHGIALIDHTSHPVRTRNVFVHDNQVFMRGTGRNGLFDPHNLNLITLPAADNLFDDNEYHVITTGGSYYEADGAKTLTTFRTAGHEASGTEVVI